MEAASGLSVGAEQEQEVNSDDDSKSFDSDEMIIDVFVDNADSDVEGQDPDLLYRHRRDYDDSESESDDEDETEPDTSNATWQRGLTKPEVIPFSGNSGFQAEEIPSPTPLDFFLLMIDESMVDSIVTETNRYAATCLRETKLSPSLRYHKWVDVTTDEMWTFFGLLLLMEIIACPDLEIYWWEDSFMNGVPFVKSIMEKDRFCLILSFFHVCNNEEQPPSDSPDYDPLFKIRKFTDKLASNFKSVFSPGENITVGDTTTAWRSTDDQQAIKLYQVCDSSTGYCCNFEFLPNTTQCSSLGIESDVISRLISPYIGCGRTSYLDKKYSRPDLFSYLKENQTLACGLVRPGKKGPSKKMVSRKKKGDVTTLTLTDGIVNFFHFLHHRQDVYILTTAHDDCKIPTVITTRREQNTVLKLKAQVDYEQYSGVVENKEEITSRSLFKRHMSDFKTKWWKRTFFHVFTQAVYNAYVLHSATLSKKVSYLDFVKDLLDHLVTYSPVRATNRFGDITLPRLGKRHRIGQVTKPGPGNKIKIGRRSCVVCTEANSPFPQFSQHECLDCDVGLHVHPCFRIYHKHEDYKEAFRKVIRQTPRVFLYLSGGNDDEEEEEDYDEGEEDVEEDSDEEDFLQLCCGESDSESE